MATLTMMGAAGKRYTKITGVSCMSINTDPEEFIKFHCLLTASAPEGYQPFYFPLEKNGKDPWKGNSWKNNRKTVEEAYKLMGLGWNIGIAATDSDPLVIVDIDDLSQVKSHKPTLENQSRKRIGRHCFYFTSDPLAKSIFDNSAKQNIATEDAGEVRANWQYVVAAGSYVPCAPEELARVPEEDRINAGKYSVMIEHKVTSITYDELPEAYRICLENKRAVDIANKQKKTKKPAAAQEKDSKNKSALWSLSIHDVTGKSDSLTFRFPSPFHGSKTYKDTSVSNGMLHCWRHNCSHTALTYLAVEAGISTCSGAGFGHNGSGGSDVDFDDPHTIYTVWNYAKAHGFIPDDDPMPTKAMVYYALQEKLCGEKDIVEGWKLPHGVYNKVIETAPFNVGREPFKKRTEKIDKILQGAMLSPIQIAEALQESIPIYYDPARNYWMWNEYFKMYERVDETEIMCQISESMDLTVYKSQMKQEILEAIRITGRKRRVQPTKKEWIQFEDLVVNIENGETFEATPEYFYSSPIPHKLGDSEDTPIIDGLFKSWHSEKAAHLCEICAYCMYDGYPIQRIFAFVGSGSNGKGQFMTLLRQLVGVENCVGTDLDRLSKSQFEASKLYKKKAAFIGETNYNLLSKTNMLKALSGGDLVSCEFKGRDSFDFVNTAKIIISTNGLPATTDRSDGFYRRWDITEFKNKFVDGKDVVNEIPEAEYQNLCRKCVRILKDILKEGRLLHEEDQETRKTKYETLSNPVQAFVNDECTVDPERIVPIWYLYDEYEKYRELKGHRRISKMEFSESIRGMGFETGPKWYSKNEVPQYTKRESEDDGKNWKSYFGLSTNPNRSSVRPNQSFFDSSEATDAIPNQINHSNQEIVIENIYRKLDKNEVRKVSPVRNDISPLELLDTLIRTEVKENYPNLVVKDEFEFERNFCNKIPYFKGSMVRSRLHLLKQRGWN